MPNGGLSVSAHRLMHLQTALLYPLELASTRIAADTAAKAEKRLYTGLLHCLQQTYYAEGPRGVHVTIPVNMHCHSTVISTGVSSLYNSSACSHNAQCNANRAQMAM